MPHRIAFCPCRPQPLLELGYPEPTPGPTTLFLAWLDSEGYPHAFQQSPEGVWTGPQSLDSGVSFSAIAAVDNYLIALDESGPAPNSGTLYAASYAPEYAVEGGWGPFQAVLPSLYEAGNAAGESQNLPVYFNDIAVTTALFDDGIYLIIVVSVEKTTFSAEGALLVQQYDAGFYAYSVNLTSGGGSLQNGQWTSISQQSLGGVQIATCPTLAPIYSGIPTVVALLGTDGTFLRGWTTIDGLDWVAADTFPEQLAELETGFIGGIPQAILLTQGATSQPLQAVMIVREKPVLCYDSSGVGAVWSYYGGLLPANVINPPNFVSIAAGIGNGGNLQVVGIGPTIYPGNLPWLVWQSTNGAWSPFPYEPSSGEYVDLANDFTGKNNPVDLAIGPGWSAGEPALQVGYLGADGNIYITWQDAGGVWHWYPGEFSNGLP